MNILFVGAHHDDLELSCGGSVKKWVADGHKVFSIILTSSAWTGPDGTCFRNPEEIEIYCQKAAIVLGYTQNSLSYCQPFELEYSDNKVTDILNFISKNKIDTIVTIWPFDAHRDHRIASEIALAASRKIPRVLLTQVSWNSTYQSFAPNYFVDITNQFEAKQAALQCYEDEYRRTGSLWEKFILSTAMEYGMKAGCEKAEGFEVLKYLY